MTETITLSKQGSVSLFPSKIFQTAPPKRVMVERNKGICTRIDGCRIINNVFVNRLTEKNYWGRIRIRLGSEPSPLNYIQY